MWYLSNLLKNRPSASICLSIIYRNATTTATAQAQWRRAFEDSLGRYLELTSQLAASDQAAHALPTLWDNQLDQVNI
jgi:TorA maturation chaperone TorD